MRTLVGVLDVHTGVRRRTMPFFALLSATKLLVRDKRRTRVGSVCRRLNHESFVEGNADRCEYALECL